MSLENDVQRWIEEQRQALLAKVEQQRRNNTAKKGVFLGKNEDGTSRVRVDGVEKRVRITGDNYLRKGDGVMVDELNTGEVKRRRRARPPELLRKKQIRKAAAKKNELISEEEEVPEGIFFGYASHVVLDVDLRYHALNLYEFYSIFDNISFIYHHDLHAGNGIQPYLNAIGVDTDTTTITHDGTLFSGGDYNAVSGKFTKDVVITSYSRDEIGEQLDWINENPDSFSGSTFYSNLQESLIAEYAEDAGQQLVSFLDQMQTVPLEGEVVLWHTGVSAGSDLFEGLEVDPIGEGLTIIYSTSLDRPWSIQGWPHAPNYFDGSSEEICVPPLCPGGITRCETVTSVSIFGTDQAFPSGYLTSSIVTTYDWYVAPYVSSPEIKDCRPSDPDSYPCGPCNCGSGFFFCDYYTWAYRQCTPIGEFGIFWGCDPITGEVIRGTGNVVTQTDPQDRQLRPYSFAYKAHEGTYPISSFSISDYAPIASDYTRKQLLTVRSSLLQTLERAIDSDYFILLDFDPLCFFGNSISNLEFVAPLLGDKNGFLTRAQTVISFVENLDKNAFVYKTESYTEAVEAALEALPPEDPRRDQLNQEIDTLNIAYENVFEQLFERYGPVLSDAGGADFDEIKVFNCFASYDTDFSSRADPSFIVDLDGFGSPAPLSFSNGTTLSRRVIERTEKARDWYFTAEDPDALMGEPTTEADKYNYILFALMCGMLGRDQVLFADFEGDEKILLQ